MKNIMRRLMTYMAIIVVMLLAGGCSTSDFRVYKSGKSFRVTSSSPEMKKILCDSGDMDSVLKDSGLPDPLQKELKEGICASGKAEKSMRNTLEGMTKEEQMALKDAFRRNGYEINKVADACGGG